MAIPRKDLFEPAAEQTFSVRAAGTVLGAPDTPPHLVKQAVETIVRAGYERTPGVESKDIIVSGAALTGALYAAEIKDSEAISKAKLRARSRLIGGLEAMSQKSSRPSNPPGSAHQRLK